MKAFARQWLLPPGIIQLLADAPPSVKRLWGGQSSKSRTEPIQLDPSGKEAASLDELIVAPYGEIVWVETEKLRLFGSAFTSEQNHWVRYFRDGFESLKRFYELHQPRNQIEAVMLDDTEVGEFSPASFPTGRRPWSFEREYRDSERLALHGSQDHGPVSRELLLNEKKRLDGIRDSVAKYGFVKLDNHDFIHFGELLVHDSRPGRPDYRVCIENGAHRTSLLSHLGWPMIPMAARPSRPWREIRLSDIARWPGVLDGTFSEQAARAYFLAHFRDPTAELLPGW